MTDDILVKLLTLVGSGVLMVLTVTWCLSDPDDT
jgi:hypothetical protein